MRRSTIAWIFIGLLTGLTGYCISRQFPREPITIRGVINPLSIYTCDFGPQARCEVKVKPELYENGTKCKVTFAGIDRPAMRITGVPTNGDHIVWELDQPPGNTGKFGFVRTVGETRGIKIHGHDSDQFDPPLDEEDDDDTVIEKPVKKVKIKAKQGTKQRVFHYDVAVVFLPKKASGNAPQPSKIVCDVLDPVIFNTD